MLDLNDMERVVADHDVLPPIRRIESLLARITGKMEIRHTASWIGGINVLFQGFGMKFHLPEKGNLSTDAGKDDPVHKNCSIFIG